MTTESYCAMWFIFFLLSAEEKKSVLSVKLLPKKPARTLRATLQYLYEKIYSSYWSERNKKSEEHDVSLDRDFKIKKKEVNFCAKLSKFNSCLLFLLNSFCSNWRFRKRFWNLWHPFSAAIGPSCCQSPKRLPSVQRTLIRFSTFKASFAPVTKHTWSFMRSWWRLRCLFASSKSDRLCRTWILAWLFSTNVPTRFVRFVCCCICFAY